MPVSRSARQNVACLFCPKTQDRGFINDHFDRYIPVLALKKYDTAVLSDEFHPVGILTAVRYCRQTKAVADRITEADWNRPGLLEWLVLTEFGKMTIVAAAGPEAVSYLLLSFCSSLRSL